MNAEAYLDTVMSIWAEKGAQTTCPLSGCCMSPLIRHGDMLVIRHGRQKIRRGHIIIFKAGDKLLVHRVVRRKRIDHRKMLLTKGDRSRSFDPLVSENQVQGRVLEAGGSNGRLDFDSLFWRGANGILALFSDLTAGDRSSPGSLRRALYYTRSTVTKILPKEFSLWDGLVRLLLIADRILTFMTKKKQLA